MKNNTIDVPMISLGNAFGTKYSVSISPESDNLSILITGKSGTGKTTAAELIETNIAEIGGVCCVLNYGETHSKASNCSGIIHWDVYGHGLPFPLFMPFTRPDGSMEDIEDASEAIVNVFAGMSKLYSRQKATLRGAIKETLCKYPGANDFRPLVMFLEECKSDTAQSVLDIYQPIFNKIRFCEPGEAILSGGHILILDMGRFSGTLQDFVSELALSILWRYFQLWGGCAKMPFFVVCDEFQRLNYGKNSTLGQVLREGRKYNIALLMATQSLSLFSNAQIVMLQQASTQLHFCPALSEVHSIARLISVDDVKKTELKLRELHRGECIATGRFRIGRVETDGPIKISFRK